jgi:ferredoxin-NADP reductase
MFTELTTRLLDTLAGPHGVDRYLELVRPTWTLHEARGEVLAVRRPTAGSVTLTVRPNGAWTGARAGQFVTVAVAIDGVRHARPYSPAGAEGAREIELTVKAHHEGLVSRHLYAHARPGMVLGLSAAAGDFVLPAARPQAVLLVSGGSGITPVMAMLRTLCAERHGGPVTFLHYAPTEDDVAYAAELADLAAGHPNVRVVTVATRRDGHLTADALRALVPDLAAAEAFVCGPPGLLDAARAIWAQAGQEARLHVESFRGPEIVLPAGEAEGEVAFTRAGASAPNSGAVLLEQAEAAGLAPEHGCRMGICFSCTCRKTTGSVRNVLTGEVSSAPDEDIRICVSVPVGDVALDL